jgi:hypothetical protein
MVSVGDGFNDSREARMVKSSLLTGRKCTDKRWRPSGITASFKVRRWGSADDNYKWWRVVEMTCCRAHLAHRRSLGDVVRVTDL